MVISDGSSPSSLTFCLDVPVVSDSLLRLGLVPHLQLSVAGLVVVLGARGCRLEHPVEH